MQAMNESQISAIRTVARNLLAEFKSWPKSRQKDDKERIELFKRYRSKYLYNSITHTVFKRFVAIESGALVDRSCE